MKTITLTAIARSLGIDPKVARAKARRRAAELNAQAKGKWEWPAKAEKKVAAFLQSDRRRLEA